MAATADEGLGAVAEAIAHDPDGFVADFYTRLFATRPDLRELFPATMEHQRAALFGVLDHILATVPDLDAHPDLIALLTQLGLDHRKFGVAPQHYEVFLDTLLTEIARLMGERWKGSTADDTTQAMMLATGVMRGAAMTATGPATWHARVVEKYRMSRDLAVVRLISQAPGVYVAGQYLEVQVPQWPRVWRSLSPSIPPNPQGELEFHVRAVPGGSVSTSIVSETAAGDVWTFAQSHGTLAIDPTLPTLFVAGGTGLAPVRALLTDMAYRVDTAPTHVFYGTRYPGELYDRFSLARLAGTNPWLTVTTVSEEEHNPWWLEVGFSPIPGVDHHIGRVADVAVAQRDWSDHQAIIAGSPEMIDYTRRALIIAGVPASRIQHDPV
ncbi:FAD-binding oxidoreductase [Williamsia sp. CHRR-6]|uniref:FAD-binding oxidoreductase n=1 Tax=Williamsia sp. CHRR-6 TaxID=2835871 RepID=UPI0027DB2B8C|nr:FAD-binding oxidoreductase [Williamsia sp. CHRR-6]